LLANSYVVVVSAAGLVMLEASGIIVAVTSRTTAFLTPELMVGVMLRTKVFARFSDQRFRQLTILFVLLVAGWMKLAWVAASQRMFPLRRKLASSAGAELRDQRRNHPPHR
jgi:hypothetical protein